MLFKDKRRDTWFLLVMTSNRIIMVSNMLRVLSSVLACCLCGHCVSAAEKQVPIRPASDGVYTLSAQGAKLYGKSVQHNEQTRAIENWTGKQDVADWKVDNSKMGNYDVAVTWSVADEDAPQSYAIQVDNRATIRAFTVSTGGKFKREVVGRILLAAGVREVTFFPSGKSCRNGLCKLKQIELVPVANLATVAPQQPVELHVPEGFEVQHVAGPPLTSHPMLAAFDNRGRLFVTESTGVNADASVLAEGPPHEIRILEDTDGDGRYDTYKVFADKLTFPEGILWHNGSVYVSSPPEFWKLTDTDGDDVADKREVLATGFTFRGMSDDMHGGSLGPDGRIYYAAGRMQHKIQRPGGPVVHEGHNPLIVRSRPDGSELEVFSGAMGNAVGVAFSDTGDCFASGTFGVNADGKRDVLNHCIEGGAYPVLGQPVVEHKLTGGELPNLAQFGASASSDLMMYRDELFGAGYRGNLFSAMFNLHKIARHTLEPDGATYRCQTEDFLTSTNADFHPTDVLEDADGSLIVLDTGAWFLIGCPTSVIAKPQLSGGIYRVSRSGSKRMADPRGATIAWSQMRPDELVALLDDSRFEVRDRAMCELAARKDDSVPALKTGLGDDQPRRRLNAVWTLTRIETPAAASTTRIALNDTDDNVRQAAAVAAGLLRDREALPQLIQLAGNDKSSPVRREAANALGRIGDKKAVPPLLSALSGVSDRFLDHALILALIRVDDREQTVAGLSDPSPEVRRGALIALDQMDHGQLSQNDVTSALATDNVRVQKAALDVIARHSGWANQITQLSKKWLADAELSEDRRSALRGVLLTFIGDGSVQELVAQSLAHTETPLRTRLLLLDVVAHSDLTAVPRSWKQPLLSTLASENTDTIRAAIEAIAATNQAVEGQHLLGQSELLALAQADKWPADIRVAAVAAAGQAGQTLSCAVFNLLVSQCGPDVEPVTRLQAASVIGLSKLSAAQLDRLVELIAAAGPLELPSLSRAIENADNIPDAQRLIVALNKSPGISALPVDRLVKLVEKMPTEFRSEADKLLKQSNADLEGQRRRLEELKDTLSGGDPERGRALFFGVKASCSACHRIGEEGGHIGPNLAGIGEIRSRRDLLEAVAFPSASFARNFEPFTLVSKSGIAQSGIISRTTSDAIYLTTGERTTIRIPRSEIEEDGIVPAGVSIMPQGLDRILQPAELKDLISFLSSLRDDNHHASN